MAPASNNRIKVENLLNNAPARGKSSHRVSPTSTNDIFNIVCGIDNCNRKFASAEALQNHQRRTHPGPTAYVCKHCKSSFSTSANLTKHVSIYNSPTKRPLFQALHVFITNQALLNSSLVSLLGKKCSWKT